MAKRNKYKFSIEGKPLYPHIKLTSERFPRILATRLIVNDGSECFGAFLNRTNARMLLDFLNRTFRLRSCDIDVDGSFNYPCTMYYKRRCVAPCVKDLADDEEYAERVRLLRLFMLNDRALFGSTLSSKISEASNRLDFESAAKWHEMLEAAESYWADTRRLPWIDETADTFTFRSSEAGLDIVLISQKGRRVLGERIFTFKDSAESDAGQAISEIIQQFYQFHAPKEIRVSIPLADKDALSKLISARIGRRVQIVRITEKNQRISTDRAVNRSSDELDVKRAVVGLSPKGLVRLLRRDLKLTRTPNRVTAIDVAHLSGADQVAASVSWANGRMDPAGPRYWLSDSGSELGSLRRFVELLVLEREQNEAELFLIDGGLGQLNAAIAGTGIGSISLVSAVKPRGDHESIAYFLTEAKYRVKFDMANEAHAFLQRLRDEAHGFANAVHRDARDYSNYFRMAEILPSLKETERRKLLSSFRSIDKVSKASKAELSRVLAADRVDLAAADLEHWRRGNSRPVRPLIVPTRLQDEMGAAEDLRPIENRSSTKY